MQKMLKNLILLCCSLLLVSSLQAQHPGNGHGNGGHNGHSNHSNNHGNNHHDDDLYEDCDCDDEDAPVCVLDSLGNSVSFPNECYAICVGFSDFVECDSTSTPYGQHDGNSNGGSCNNDDDDDDDDDNHHSNPYTDCDCDDEDAPVCALDSLGNSVSFPNECYAICVGFTEFVECDSTSTPYWEHGHDGHGGGCNNNGGHDGNHNDNPYADCDCDDDDTPVCALDSLGNSISFPNECYALCVGFTEFVECDSTSTPYWEHGHGGHGGGCNNDGDDDDEDCECDDTYDPVCIFSDTDTLFFLNPCLAACEGYGEDDWSDCQGDSVVGNDGPQLEVVSTYPNPIQHAVTIIIETNVAGAHEFIFYDFAQQPISHTTQYLQAGSNQITLSTAQFRGGVYYLSVFNGKATTMTTLVK